MRDVENLMDFLTSGVSKPESNPLESRGLLFLMWQAVPVTPHCHDFRNNWLGLPVFSCENTVGGHFLPIGFLRWSPIS